MSSWDSIWVRVPPGLHVEREALVTRLRQTGTTAPAQRP
jgi:hypothetical protein